MSSLHWKSCPVIFTRLYFWLLFSIFRFFGEDLLRLLRPGSPVSGPGSPRPPLGFGFSRGLRRGSEGPRLRPPRRRNSPARPHLWETVGCPLKMQISDGRSPGVGKMRPELLSCALPRGVPAPPGPRGHRRDLDVVVRKRGRAPVVLRRDFGLGSESWTDGGTTKSFYTRFINEGGKRVKRPVWRLKRRCSSPEATRDTYIY